MPIQNCSICGTTLPQALTLTQQSYCQKIECKLSWQRNQHNKIHQHRSQQKALYESARDKRVQHFLVANNLEASDINLVELPYVDTQSSAPPEERLSDFREFLHKLLQTLDEVEDETLIRSPNKTLEHSATALKTLEFCASCQGKCCHKGRQYHSFLQRHTLLKAIQENPHFSIANELNEPNPESIVETYLSHIPEESITDSCLYHTASGCALPGNLRANICSEFYCNNLSDFINKSVSGEAKKHTISVNEQNNTLINIQIIQ
ncbi:hypothetical protein SAMN02745866_00295 [Alteromonadaceae bacterium Bs31]|nr:hypothetical protein SAMN02745866_00295 [Alteromonadaceae bacterium Bs31]